MVTAVKPRGWSGRKNNICVVVMPLRLFVYVRDKYAKLCFTSLNGDAADMLEYSSRYIKFMQVMKTTFFLKHENNFLAVARD
jgi:hypothetical protein